MAAASAARTKWELKKASHSLPLRGFKPSTGSACHRVSQVACSRQCLVLLQEHILFYFNYFLFLSKSNISMWNWGNTLLSWCDGQTQFQVAYILWKLLSIFFSQMLPLNHFSFVKSDRKLTLFPSAIITLPRWLRLLLMAWVSFNLWPSDPESFNLSLPARSTKFKVPVIHTSIDYNQNSFCSK